MPQSSLSKREIFKVLLARRISVIEFYSHFSVLSFTYFEPIRKLGHHRILRSVGKGGESLINLVAMRLAIGGTGKIITHDENKQMFCWVMNDLISQLPEYERPQLQAMTEPMVDFLMCITSVWYAQTTYEAEIEYLEVVSVLAATHMLDPITFIKRIPDAHDNILRWMYSPQSYRDREMARYDAVPAQRLEELFVQAVRGCEDAIHLGFTNRIDERKLRAMIPGMLRFWRHRAARTQLIEQNIERIWPGCNASGALEV